MKKIYFKYLHLKFWAVKKHFVDKDVEWHVSCEKLLDALFSCHKHHTSERTILLNIPFFPVFFFFFFVKTYWEKEKKRKLEIHTSFKSLKLKQYLEPLMRKRGGIGVIYTMLSSSLICNVHRILYNNALTKGKRRLAVQRNPNVTGSLESHGWRE